MVARGSRRDAPRAAEQPRLSDLVRSLLTHRWGEVDAAYFLDEYLRSQWLPEAALRERQSAALRRLAWRCLLDVPFYAAAAPALALAVPRIDGAGALASLPIQRAAERRLHPERFACPSSPAEIAEARARREAVRLRAERWAEAWAHGDTTAPAGVARDRWLSIEAGLIAAACERAGAMHVLADHCLVEVVDDRGRARPPGASGDLLLTGLHDLATPRLRLELGLRGRLLVEPCPCGRAMPLLEVEVPAGRAAGGA